MGDGEAGNEFPDEFRLWSLPCRTPSTRLAGCIVEVAEEEYEVMSVSIRRREDCLCEVVVEAAACPPRDLDELEVDRVNFLSRCCDPVGNPGRRYDEVVDGPNV